MIDIEVLHRPSKETFLERTGNLTKPVVLKDSMNGWKAMGSWTTASLGARFGDLTVTVVRSPDGVYRGDPQAGFEHLMEKMTLKDFMSLIEEPNSLPLKYYLVQRDISGPFSELRQEVEIPIYLERKLLHRINLWCGPADTISPLHYDLADNLFCQVLGTKKVILFSPVDTARVYPFPITSKIRHVSRVDIRNPDLQLFPEFRQASALETILSAGDMIYIPKIWWHDVHSLSFSISVNFWYARP